MSATTGLSQSQELPSQVLPSQAAEPSSPQTNLACRYGAIGIHAVAAAARYCGEVKAGAPAAAQIDQRFIEFAV